MRQRRLRSERGEEEGVDGRAEVDVALAAGEEGGVAVDSEVCEGVAREEEVLDGDPPGEVMTLLGYRKAPRFLGENFVAYGVEDNSGGLGG
jgi:hypothetical protein